MIWFIVVGVVGVIIGYYVGWKEAVYNYCVDEKREREHELWKKS